MLRELHIESLGVIDSLTVPFGPGLTALTGETGAGKTMLVEALALLLGGRADAGVVRHGCAEARVEGRFEVDGVESVVGRVIPADGRSRAYRDGRLITAATLAELVGGWVELHGQNTHQRLATAADQRAALDRWAGTDLAPLVEVRTRLRQVDEAIGALGGDSRAKARQIDLLRYQLDELRAAALGDPDEDERLAEEQDTLAQAESLRLAAATATAALRGDGGAVDAAGLAVHALGHAAVFAGLVERLRAAAAELADAADEIRQVGERIIDDPERAEAVRIRRQQLRDLRRKYGDSLAEVIAFRDQVAGELDELSSHDQRLADLETERAQLAVSALAAAATVGRVRRAAAGGLARQMAERLQTLAMPAAAVEVRVGAADPGDEVEILLAANPGSPPAPLAKAASGGELARTMLALRLVLSADPETMVFDEVDAGIGGQAAVAVGRSLAELAAHRQVLVVTHLAQVAALADHHVVVAKSSTATSTSTAASVVTGEARVTEVARLLSGHERSESARAHAEELLGVR